MAFSKWQVNVTLCPGPRGIVLQTTGHSVTSYINCIYPTKLPSKVIERYALRATLLFYVYMYSKSAICLQIRNSERWIERETNGTHFRH